MLLRAQLARAKSEIETLLADVRAYLNGLSELFVQDLYCGADPALRLSCRYVTPNAWHANFVRNMFIRPDVADLASFAPNFTVYHAPEFHADTARHGTRTGTFIVLNLATREILWRGRTRLYPGGSGLTKQAQEKDKIEKRKIFGESLVRALRDAGVVKG